MKGRSAHGVAVLPAALLMVLCSSCGGHAAEAHHQTPTVTIKSYAFAPAALTVSAGDTVVWTNRDPTAHTVTADGGGRFNSAGLSRGASYRVTFRNPGTFHYHCAFHPFMQGTVVVHR